MPARPLAGPSDQSTAAQAAASADPVTGLITHHQIRFSSVSPFL